MRYYKLTDKYNQTHDGTQWGENVIHKAIGEGKDLCSPDVIHVYDHPLKAVMFNLIHAAFSKYNLWECNVRKVVADDGLKVGVKQCTTIRRIEAPIITTEQRVRFAIYCALEVNKEKSFVLWAENWLSGKDRTVSAAFSAARSGESATLSAELAAMSAARSGESAALSAESAAFSAAMSAGEALSAESASKSLDFVALIKKAIKEENEYARA